MEKEENRYEQFLREMKDISGFDKSFLKRRPMELSGGQRQVLSVMIAKYLTDTSLVLLDEPFSRMNLDLEEKVIKRLIGVDKEGEIHWDGRTYMIISHRKKLLKQLVPGIAVVSAEKSGEDAKDKDTKIIKLTVENLPDMDPKPDIY